MYTGTLELSMAPYPGLRPFRADEADIFFGRERQTDALLSKLAEHRFLAVIGPSGCGKSSLVRAGLIPALETGFMAQAGSHWRIAYMRPGPRPLRSLAEALLDTQLLDHERAEQPDAAVFLEASLRRGPLGLIDIVRSSALEADANLLVLVDQFEELFRFSNQDHSDEADAFISLLIESAAAKRERIYVAITMRSDFLSECAAFHGLPEMINKGLYLTPRLTRTECSACITNPARVFGAAVDPALVNRLLNDFGPDPDQLPLLQHSLLQMWKRHLSAPLSADKVVMDAADYDAVGGMARSLSDHAEVALAELGPGDRRIAEMIFRCLADTRAERRDRRRPTKIADIATWGSVTIADIIRVADVFRRRGRWFLMPSEEVPLTADTVLDVSHESLLRQWPTLVAWIQDESESAAIYRRLREAAHEWRRGDAAVWTSPALDRAQAWRTRASTTPTWALRYGSADEFTAVREFLDASQRAHRAKHAQQRHARRLRIASLIAAITATAGVLGFIAYNVLYVWEYTAEYRSYVRVFGEPHGIQRLSGDDMKHRARSFRIVTAGRIGHVKRMYAVNSQGELAGVVPDYSTPEFNDQTTSIWSYEYDIDGRVSAERQYARNHAPVLGRIYMGPRGDDGRVRSTYFIGPKGTPIMVAGPSDHSDYYWVETVQYSDEGYEQLIGYLGRHGEQVRGRDHAFAQRQDYDGMGNTIRLVSLGADGKPMNDAYGNATLEASYDGRGNEIEARALDAEGKPTTIVDGWAIKRARFDRYGNESETSYYDIGNKPVATTAGWHAVQRTYDERGNVTEERYLDAARSPAVDATGRSFAYSIAYDKAGRVSRRTCLDATGRPMHGLDGSVTTTWRYDDRDHPIEEAYFDASGKPTLSKNGYAKVATQFDGLGRIVEIAYAGVDGKRIVAKGGRAGTTMRYDDQGHVTSTTYVGLDFEPVPGEAGYAITKETLDGLGQAIEEHYLDVAGHPMIIKNGYAGLRSTYDDHGRATEVYYLGIDGEVVFGDDGYAGWRSEFDPFGRRTKVTYLGLRREPIASVDRAIVSMDSVFDARGREVRQTYLGHDGKPAIASQGEAGWVASYDDLGNRTSITYIDMQGNPTLHSWDEKAFTGSGYARHTQTYDVLGLVHEEAYDGADLQRILGTNDWSRAMYTYNDRGERISSSYFGVTNEPMKVKGLGYHTVRYKNNDYGQRIECTYYDTDEITPMIVMQGYARLVNAFDRFGEIAEQQVFGLDGKPAVLGDGASRNSTTRDEHGWKTKCEQFGPGGESDRITLTEYAYDASGHQVEERNGDPRDPRGRPISSPAQPCAVIQQQWIDQTVHERRCLDADRKLTAGFDGHAKEVFTWDRPGQQTSVRYYDKNDVPVVSKDGYAGVRYKYDDFGRRSEIAYLDVHGRLARTGLAFARATMAYDTQTGNLVEEAYFTANGLPVDPVAKLVSVFDPLHRKTEERYLSAGDAPVAFGRTGQHVTLYKYDTYGRLSELTYLDTQLRPTRGYAVRYDHAARLCGRWVPDHDDDGDPTGPGTCYRKIPRPPEKS
jgi:hypothetical protein